MNIYILGSGAMGMLFGGKLSKNNDVTCVCRRQEQVDELLSNGLNITEKDGRIEIYHLNAICPSTLQNSSLTGNSARADLSQLPKADLSQLPKADLVLIFVKSCDTMTALEEIKDVIGPDPTLWTLQNGAGQEYVMREFTDDAHILIGKTMQGSVRESDSSIRHSGIGETYIAAGHPDVASILKEAGFSTTESDNIAKIIWKKLLVNGSSSVLSGLLQVPQGDVLKSESAWNIVTKLIREMCAVAAAEGCDFDVNEQIAAVKANLEGAMDAVTSLYVDLNKGRTTEVDYINGYVVKKGAELGIPVPTHEVITDLVHVKEQMR